jgi:WD40 repeat protein
MYNFIFHKNIYLLIIFTEMVKFTNENILKLIFNNFVSKLKPLFDKTNNKAINEIILKTLTYEDIIKSLKAKPIFNECTSMILAMIMLSNGNIVLASADNKLQVWDLINQKCLKSLTEKYVVKYLIALPNDIIVSAAPYYKIKVRDAKNDYNIIKEIDPGSCVSSIILLNTAYIAYATYAAWDSNNNSSNNITIIDYFKDNLIVEQLKGHKSSVHALANLPDNKFASACCEIRIWDIIDNSYINFKTLKGLNGHQYNVMSLLFDEKRGLLISGSCYEINVWDLKNDYQCIKTITSNTGLDKCILLPKGFIAYGGYSGNIIISNLTNFMTVNILDEHESPVKSMFLLNDKWIISVSSYKKLLWELGFNYIKLS